MRDRHLTRKPDRRRSSQLRALPVCLLAAGLLLGPVSCQEESKSDDGVGGLEVSAAPEGDVFADDVLVGSARLSHPPDVEVTFFDWQWTVDGVDSGITTINVPAIETTKHEVWQVSARADYGTGVTERAYSNELTILNTPPVISPLSIRPIPMNQRCQFTTLSVMPFVANPDGDPITFSYEWRVNDVLVATTPTLDPSFFSVGDQVRVQVTANDGEVDGPPVLSGTATIVMCPLPLTASPPGAGSFSTLQRAPTSRVVSDAEAGGFLARGTRAGGDAAGPPDETAAGESAARETATGDAADANPSPLSINETNVCSLAADGSLQCSGSDQWGLTRSPEGVFSQVQVGLDYACAIRATDAGIACWGEPLVDVGQLAPPEGPFVQIDLGVDAACGVREGGEIACWGDPAQGLSAPPEGPFTHVDVSDAYACAIRPKGAVHCWGAAE